MRPRSVDAADVKSGIELCGDLHIAAPFRHFYAMGLSGTANGIIRGGKTQVHSIQPEQLSEIGAINYGKNIKAVNAGNHAFGFNIGQAAGIDDKFFNPSGFSQRGAGELHVPQGEAHVLAQIA